MNYSCACEQARTWSMTFGCPFFVVQIAAGMYEVVARALQSDAVVARFA